MKNFLRGLILAGCLVFMPANRAQDKPAPPPPIEYNIAGCAQDGFTVDHVLIYNDKIQFTHRLAGAGKIEKIDPVVEFDYKDAVIDGVHRFEAKGDSPDGKKITIRGIFKGKHLVATAFFDGTLGEIFYGKLGKAEDIAKEHTGPDNDDDFKFCFDLVQLPPDVAATLLFKWLEDAEPDQKNLKTS